MSSLWSKMGKMSWKGQQIVNCHRNKHLGQKRTERSQKTTVKDNFRTYHQERIPKMNVNLGKETSSLFEDINYSIPDYLQQECGEFPKMTKAATLMSAIHMNNPQHLMVGMLRSFVDYGPSSDLRLSCFFPNKISPYFLL